MTKTNEKDPDRFPSPHRHTITSELPPSAKIIITDKQNEATLKDRLRASSSWLTTQAFDEIEKLEAEIAVLKNTMMQRKRRSK